ncbi:hypothetical protein [Tenacibaculum finnmarkense]|uniref:Lipoprotein n=1 Tax=Tenacibaculum finnmarkense genomovar ulcerans TaxID=2781388 RepID=A0A2I2M6U1_9FLAO|nr:hypothetical protein [Tenacibaculum finnmarkense]MBE7696476.1 hypothetical protein [Tenacibaculum finnmarkense genomovar ulcerans]SOU88268.1 hypothetical protein TNO010_150219 [Tenacibaculum finnmarkense genomovar ulcerans]
MKKRYIYIIIICVFIFSCILFLRNKESYSYVEKGNEMINKVYLYKKEHKKFPDSTSNFIINTEMGQGPYYKKLNDTVFIVYYNLGLDHDQLIFNSFTKEWK